MKRFLIFPLLCLCMHLAASPFHRAAFEGDLKTLETMLDRGFFVDEPDELGRTALMRAAWGDRSRAIRLLLEHGADPGRVDANGQTALFHSLQFGRSLESLRLLLDAGADPASRDNRERTAAGLLVLKGINPSYLSLLFEYGLDPRLQTREGSLFHTILKRPEPSGLFYENLYMGGVPLVLLDDEGRTALQTALEKGETGRAGLLEQLQIRLNEELITALEDETVREKDILGLLERGGESDYRNRRGFTPCHYAVASGRPDLLQLLLIHSEGPLPFLEDGPSMNSLVLFFPLDYGTERALPLLEILLDGGLPVNVRSEEGRTLLSAGIMHSEQTAALLLSHGADPNLPDPRGVMPLMRAMTRSLNPGGDLLEELAAAGADLKARDDEGWDVLTYALLYGQDVSVVRRLLALGIDPEERDDYGTPGYFWAAAFSEDADLVSLLCSPRSRGRQRDKDGWTPLMGALNFGNSPEVVALLARMETDGRIRDGSGRNLRDFAAVYRTRTGNDIPEELERLIRSRRTYPPSAVPMTVDPDHALLETVLWGREPALVEELTDAGADPSAPDDLGLTPLMNAAAYNDASMVRALLDAGASPFDVSPCGWTALHLVSWSSDTGSLALLLDQGLDPDMRDFENWTPLMWAARNSASPAFMRIMLDAGARGDLFNYRQEGALQLACSAWKEPETAVLELLLEAGGDIDAVGAGGMSALMHAAGMGYERSCRLLIEKGADPGIRNREGESAASLARRNGHVDLADFLQDQIDGIIEYSEGGR